MARMAYCVNNLGNGKCGAPCLDSTFKPLPGAVFADTFSRGGRRSYICPDCARKWERIQNGSASMTYYNENNVWSGEWSEKQNRKAYKFSFGQELETVYPTTKSFIELVTNNYLPTADCTVDVEYKSPIYRGRQSIAKYADTIERMINTCDITIKGQCGTHTHCGAIAAPGHVHGRFTAINTDFMNNFLRRRSLYTLVFKPVTDWMAERPEAVTAFFGRGLGGWASVPDWHYPEEHSNFVNVQHENTIEFRLPKFKTAAQYRLVLEWIENVTEIICAAYDFSTDESIRMEAEKAGQKILKYTEKLWKKNGLF